MADIMPGIAATQLHPKSSFSGVIPVPPEWAELRVCRIEVPPSHRLRKLGGDRPSGPGKFTSSSSLFSVDTNLVDRAWFPRAV